MNEIINEKPSRRSILGKATLAATFLVAGAMAGVGIYHLPKTIEHVSLYVFCPAFLTSGVIFGREAYKDYKSRNG